MKLKHLLTAAWALALVGCYNDTEEMRPEPTPVPLRVEAYVNDLQTRAGYDTESLMEFGLYVDLNGEAENEDGWDNVQVSRTATDQPWTLAPQPYWPSDESTATFYAYAPYADAVSNPAQYSFSVQANQSTAANVTASDLLWGSGTGTGTDKPLEVTLNHKLCKLKVILVPDETLAGNITFTDVQLESVTTTMLVNLTSGELGTRSNLTSIRMLKNEEGTEWECICLPSATQLTLRISATIGGEPKGYYYQSSESQQFVSGNSYSLTLYINADEVEPGNFTIKGWTEEDEIELTPDEPTA